MQDAHCILVIWTALWRIC